MGLGIGGTSEGKVFQRLSAGGGFVHQQDGDLRGKLGKERGVFDLHGDFDGLADLDAVGLSGEFNLLALSQGLVTVKQSAHLQPIGLKKRFAGVTTPAPSVGNRGEHGAAALVVAGDNKRNEVAALGTGGVDGEDFSGGSESQDGFIPIELR